MKKKRDYSFLDDSVYYKTGMKEEDYDAMRADARKRAAIKYQMKLEEERHQQRKNKINEIKEHAIPFGLVCTDFKIVFILSIIACLGNFILSIIYKSFLWTNFFNLFAILIIFFAGKHLYAVQEDENDERISKILKQNICQVSSDLIQYKLADFFKVKANTISDIISIVSAVCFAVFSSQNILYATCIPLCLFMIFLLTGLKKFAELNSHLQLLNKSLLLGILIKAIYNLIFAAKFIQLDYMNIALLFLFTCVKMWLIDEEAMFE